MRLPLAPSVQYPASAVFPSAPLPPPQASPIDSLTRTVEASILRHDRKLRLIQPRAASAASSVVPLNTSVVSSVLAELGLDDYVPLLTALPPGLVRSGSSGGSGSGECVGSSGGGSMCDDAADLRSFVRRVSRIAANNPLLTQLAHRLSTEEAHLEPVEDEEMYELAHYVVLLDGVTTALASDPELAARVYARLRETVHRHTPNWWRPLGLFELAKLLTVEMTLERFIEHRQSGDLPANFGHIGLPFNILEAVLQDLKLGFTTNAAAGLALCVARPGQADRPGKPGRGATLSADGRRAVRMHLPHEHEWKHLYVSWNLAFTTAYADVPTRFGAPLLAPCVLGAPPDEFMFYRVLALHTHICLYIRRRAREVSTAPAASSSLPAFLSPAVASSAAAADATTDATTDRRREARQPSRSLTELWGSINFEAAQRYERRLRLYPFVAASKLTLKSAFAARSVPYPYSLILPPPRTVYRGMVVSTRQLSARERAERRQR